VWIFYEVSQLNLTLDYLLTHPNKHSEAIKTWMEDHAGPLSNFPFGVFAFARLEDHLSDSELWRTSPNRKKGRDAMNLTPQQPNIEIFNTEAYGGGPANFPITTESAFAMLVNLFGLKSRGCVKLKSADSNDKPVVGRGYLSEPLGALVLAEGCALANEIVMEGNGMRDVVTGSWPRGVGHHEFKGREDWMEYIQEMATTCELSFHP
jgi:hypothetical protein